MRAVSLIPQYVAIGVFGITCGLVLADAAVFGLGVFCLLVAFTLCLCRDRKRNRAVTYGDWRRL